MTILTDLSKIKSNISSDISPELFLNSIDVNFLTGKAIESLIENGVNPQLKSSESILNSIYYLIAELEENHQHERDIWLNSEIFKYVGSINKTAASE
ncbi:hypothetical protein [Acinetobacter proteolyticus]|uniref:Uncharacterized protein n=1 Tax=Acinetobacter proteolyticus TaxID=1776741 RepID=A0A2N0WIC0_9GAMM|nr:hypothetical protein [Acinetobacter proteolyticus]MBK5645829.1 hypothetical protein [Acinetobacter sp.]PKF35524.1 hypothetical protein CW311_04335 [Acinetobacter proteolyticus]